MDLFVATKTSIWLAGSVLALALFAPPAMAIDFEGIGVEHRQKRAEATQNFIDDLELTVQQARGLMPILDEAAQLHLEAYREESEILPRAVEAYEDLLEEARLDHGLSEEVEGRASRINRQVKDLRDGWNEDVRHLEEEA
ncbi:MAG: hypothetical protein HN348_20650, partial [Proteobacteria bacterium]|nr:hypothetical protein [Pseudomonadota bacterium]